jgi:arginine/lysine/ornithine decarboxylase
MVPDDLQGHVNRKELWYSLKTGYLGVAKIRARFIVGNIQMLFSSLRRGDSPLKQLTPELVNDLIRQYRDMAIEDAMRPVNRNQNDPTKWDYGMREIETMNEIAGCPRL